MRHQQRKEEEDVCDYQAVSKCSVPRFVSSFGRPKVSVF